MRAVFPVPAAASTSSQIVFCERPQTRGFVGEPRHRTLQILAKSPKARPNAACLLWK
jgi:hypothetical protein